MTTAAAVAERRRSPWSSWLATTDHKRLGIMTIGLAFFWFLVAGLIAGVMRAELAWPALQFLSFDGYNQLFSQHGTTMFFHFFGPAAFGLGLYMIPLQIGAADVALPRLNLFAFWVQAASGLVLYLGFAGGWGASKAGWYTYWPLNDDRFLPNLGQDLYFVSVLLAAVAQFIWSATLLATILRFRAPGMTMLRLPVFTWSVLVTCFMGVASYPMLAAGMTLVLGDRQFDWNVFDRPSGPGTYQNIWWYWAHPIVYIVFFPFLGAVAEAVSALSGRRFFGYRFLVLSFLLFAGLSMAVWQHHMFTTGYVSNYYAALTSTIILVPAGIEYFDTIGTMMGGRVRLKTPMLFSIAFLVQFLIGGISGIWQASPPLDYHVHDTYHVVAHFHYTLAAGSLFGLWAAFYYWFPKVFGVVLHEGLGKLHFWFATIGINLVFFPMFFLGWEGMSRRVADYTPSEVPSWWLNTLETAGYGILFVGVLFFVINLFVSLKRRRPAEDPWEGHALEWWTTSPPPRHNFDSLPPIRSYAPMFDWRNGFTRPTQD